MAEAAASIGRNISANVDVEVIIAEHPGPACLFDGFRRPLLANSHWIAAGLPDPDGPGRQPAPATLAVQLLAATRSGATAVSTLVQKVQHRETETIELTLEMTVVPVAFDGRGAFLVLGADRTIVGTLQGALAESREFHRSFVRCSADFIWQVDGAGVIDYSGPRGLLDYSAEDLFGAPISSFFVDPDDVGASLVFTSREPIWEQEVWLADREGEKFCFLVSSVPVRGEDGRWNGARGIGRDVTEQRIREAELQKARQSQRLVHSVLHAMRSEVDPRAILNAAAVVAADTARLDGCLVLKLDPATEAGGEWIAMTLPAAATRAAFEQAAPTLMQRVATGPETGGRRIQQFSTGGCHYLISATLVEGEVNGAVVFMRLAAHPAEADTRIWAVEESHILRAVADQMGVALAQFDLVEGLRRKDIAHAG